MRRKERLAEAIIVAAVTLLGAALRLFRLDNQSIWLDEGYQYDFASTSSFSGVLERVLDPEGSTHPPLSHLINHVFLQISATDFSLRLPSALFGIASLPLVYLVTKRLISERAALLATVLMAISPYHVWFSQEARMYAQLTFFVLLSSLALLRALDRRGVAWWTLYALGATAGMYTHIYMGFTLAAHGMWILMFERRAVVPFTVTGLAVVVAFSPLLPFFLGARDAAPQDIPVGSVGFSWAALPYTAFAFATGFSLGPTLRELKVLSSSDLAAQFWPVVGVTAAAFGILAIAGVAFLWTRSKRAMWFCVLTVTAPVVGSVAMSLFPWMTFNVRYANGALPSFFVLVAVGFLFLYARSRALGAILGVAAVLISLASLYNHYTDTRYAKEDVRDAVAAWHRDGAGTYMTTNVVLPVERYLEPGDRERYLTVRDEDHIVREAQGLLARVEGSTLWIIVARDFRNTLTKKIRASLVVSEERSFPGGVTMFKVAAVRSPTPAS